MLMPFPILLSSQLQKRKKVSVLGLFSLGGFITVIQLIRIFTIKNLASFLGSWPIILWSMVESNLGIIVCCIPPLAPLFKTFSTSLSKTSSKATGASRSVKLSNLSSASRRTKHSTIEEGAEDFDGHALLNQDDSTIKQIIELHAIRVTSEVSVVECAACPDTRGIVVFHATISNS